MAQIGRYLICLRAGQHYPMDTNANDHLQTRSGVIHSRASFRCGPPPPLSWAIWGYWFVSARGRMTWTDDKETLISFSARRPAVSNHAERGQARVWRSTTRLALKIRCWDHALQEKKKLSCLVQIIRYRYRLQLIRSPTDFGGWL